jgi:hypothetical protein
VPCSKSLIGKREGETFTDALNPVKDARFYCLEPRFDAAQDERAYQPYAVETPADQMPGDGLHVDHEIREFRHGMTISRVTTHDLRRTPVNVESWAPCRWRESCTVRNVPVTGDSQRRTPFRYEAYSSVSWHVAAERSRTSAGTHVLNRGAQILGASGNLDLPVSLERIREALARTPERPLQGLKVSADFTVTVQERQRFTDLLPPLDMKSTSPPPPMQPYAAFNAGQLITIAIENLVAKFLGGRLLTEVENAERARAEAAAKAEVARAIAEYCDARGEARWRIDLCTGSPLGP